MKKRIELVSQKFLEKTQDKEIQVVSHFDTDGITSAAIIIKTLQKLDKTFYVKIVKDLNKETIDKLPRDKIILFLDLASGSLDQIGQSDLQDVFIIDHHEITQEIPANVHIINPELFDKEKISGSGLSYLFATQINPSNKSLAKLAILGMIGDMLEKNVDKLNSQILSDGDILRKRGLLLYPSTRPLNRVLEYNSNPFIPGVTGNQEGVSELLREANLVPRTGPYKSLVELNEEEMKSLVTAILLRLDKSDENLILGDIYLMKFFNKLEDAREMSAMINACSRMGNPEIALMMCLENPHAKKRATSLHIKYRQLIVSALKFVSKTEKVKGNGFVIINAKDNIKDTMVGTIASILSSSQSYEAGTIITTMAYRKNKIKISARNVGRTGRNVREALHKVVSELGGEVGGHEFAAGSIIEKHQENDFIEKLKKHLEIEMVKV